MFIILVNSWSPVQFGKASFFHVLPDLEISVLLMDHPVCHARDVHIMRDDTVVVPNSRLTRSGGLQ